MADRLIVYLSQHQVLFQKRHKNDKNNDLKENKRYRLYRSVADLFG